MGSMWAQGMAEWAGLEEGVRAHLRYNHYPPVPEYMVPIALKAINHARVYEWDELIELPKGTTFKRRTSAFVYELVEALHLEPWVTQNEEES